jgi:hypothetical protein
MQSGSLSRHRPSRSVSEPRRTEDTCHHCTRQQYMRFVDAVPVLLGPWPESGPRSLLPTVRRPCTWLSRHRRLRTRRCSKWWSERWSGTWSGVDPLRHSSGGVPAAARGRAARVPEPVRHHEAGYEGGRRAGPVLGGAGPRSGPDDDTARSLPLHLALRRKSHPNRSPRPSSCGPSRCGVGVRNGSTVVHLAVAHRAPTLETVRLLLLRAVDQAQNLLAATDTNGSTPLPVAVARSDASWDLVQNRIEQRPDAARSMDQKGFMRLRVAALNDAPVDVLYLLARRFPEAAYKGRLACGMLEEGGPDRPCQTYQRRRINGRYPSVDHSIVRTVHAMQRHTGETNQRREGRYCVT